jgi:transcriptional repressor NrdR
MKCPFCENQDTAVIDSREASDGKVIRRRRNCEKCKGRFTTYERPELTEIKVFKKDGSLETYQRSKIEKGLKKATKKRPISEKKLIEVLDTIESKVFALNKEKVKSKTIGKLIIEELKKLDHVAYLRFISVYRSFGSIASFDKEIKKLKEKYANKSKKEKTKTKTKTKAS